MNIMQKIRKSVIAVLVFIVFLLFFGYYLIRFNPFDEDINYNPRYITNENISSSIVVDGYSPVYSEKDNRFVGVNFYHDLLNKNIEILVSQTECFDFFLQKQGKDINFDYNNYKTHISVISYTKFFWIKEYMVPISVYYDGYYIQSWFSCSDYEDYTFTNVEQVSEAAKDFCGKLIKIYDKSKEEIKSIFKTNRIV